MSFERVFDHSPAPAAPLAAGLPVAHRKTEEFRVHRALRRLTFRRADFLCGLGFSIVASSGWVLLLPWVCHLWSLFLRTGIELLRLNASVVVQRHALWRLRFNLPSVEMLSLPPDWSTWATTMIVCSLLLTVSYRLPHRYTPVAYLLRFALAIQGSALVYFAAVPARFPHGSTDFIASTIAAGVVLIGLVPAIFTVIYYVFDFGLWRKALLTLLTMSHLAVFVPLQALVHAYALHRSLLFMPVLFLLFGMPLQILIVVSFYSWGMSWETS